MFKHFEVFDLWCKIYKFTSNCYIFSDMWTQGLKLMFQYFVSNMLVHYALFTTCLDTWFWLSSWPVYSDFRTSFFLGSTIFCTTTRKSISILFTKSKTLTSINLKCIKLICNNFWTKNVVQKNVVTCQWFPYHKISKMYSRLFDHCSFPRVILSNLILLYIKHKWTIVFHFSVNDKYSRSYNNLNTYIILKCWKIRQCAIHSVHPKM